MAFPDHSHETHIPPWLHCFLHASFFTACKPHSSERNHFCVDCFFSGPLCALGLVEHASHTTLQVRKASHHNAVRVADVLRLLDVSLIQTYVINGARIVFLSARPQRGSKAGSFAAGCEGCGRGLVDAVRYCSLSCKFSGLMEDEEVHNSSLLLAPPEGVTSGLRCSSGEHEQEQFCFSGEVPPVGKWSHGDQARELSGADATRSRKVRKLSSVIKAKAGKDMVGSHYRTIAWPRRSETPSTKVSTASRQSPPPAPSTPPSTNEALSLRSIHRRKKGTPCRSPLS